jgi:hypothetical protein
MMQEHRSLIKRASAWSRKDSWIAPASYFENTLEIVAPLFHEVIHKEAHLYCIIDRKAFISFNAVR